MVALLVNSTLGTWAGSWALPLPGPAEPPYQHTSQERTQPQAANLGAPGETRISRPLRPPLLSVASSQRHWNTRETDCAQRGRGPPGTTRQTECCAPSPTPGLMEMVLLWGAVCGHKGTACKPLRVLNSHRLRGSMPQPPGPTPMPHPGPEHTPYKNIYLLCPLPSQPPVPVQTANLKRRKRLRSSLGGLSMCSPAPSLSHKHHSNK